MVLKTHSFKQRMWNKTCIQPASESLLRVKCWLVGQALFLLLHYIQVRHDVKETGDQISAYIGPGLAVSCKHTDYLSVFIPGSINADTQQNPPSLWRELCPNNVISVYKKKKKQDQTPSVCISCDFVFLCFSISSPFPNDESPC